MEGEGPVCEAPEPERYPKSGELKMSVVIPNMQTDVQESETRLPFGFVPAGETWGLSARGRFSHTDKHAPAQQKYS